MRTGASIALLLSWAVSAHAQSTARDGQARAAADGGAALFRAGDFLGAAAQFKAAYELNQDPGYLFNAAQAYRRAGDCVEAADFYGRFLGMVPDPPNADKVRSWYASQLECANARNRPPKTAVEHAIEQPVEKPEATGRQEHHGRRALTISLAATGVVALGVGGFFVWDAHYLDRQRDSAAAMCTLGSPCSSAVINDYDRRGSRANTLGVIGLGVGTLALAASAALFEWTW